MPDPSVERMFARMQELKSNAEDPSQAFGIAWLEERVRQWPNAWGDDLHILLYGDFRAPSSILEYPSLGMTVHPERIANSIISRGAPTVVKAIVKVDSKSVASLVEAVRRINLMLGAYTLHQWGNGSIGWWSWVTHGGGAGMLTDMDMPGADKTINAVRSLSLEVRKRVEAALFWVREPRNTLHSFYRSDIIKRYSSYWNAFECLVEAVNIARPRPTISRSAKQVQLEAFLSDRSGQLSIADIEFAYRNIVDTGFRGKAKYALKVCFPNDGERYAMECFELPAKRDRLYEIRNAINHGTIDAENPEELVRIEARLHRLWMIVWRMFACFVPFPAPADPAQPSDGK